MTGGSLHWNGEAPRGVRWPTALKPGDTVGLFAPSHQFNRQEVERGAALLRSWGFEVKVPPHIFKKHKYFAGTDEDRLAVLDSLMSDDSVSAVMAVRGGYGSQRLLPYLIMRWRKWKPKPIIGFSDLTALHLARFTASGVIGYHAPMAVSLGKEESAKQADTVSIKDLKKALTSPDRTGAWNFSKKDVINGGHVKGLLLGGNLTMFIALLSGPWMPDLNGVILMLEEVDEPGYRLDRLLVTLRQSPGWKKAAGLVFGHFTHCGPARQVRSLLLEAAEDFHGPVVMNGPFGHERRNRFFPIGATAVLEA
ncbi:hypothetical protein C4J81_13200 [Deltaproteobacteria bacterium Smac51]|nr:hypothetical protein C4J81_13200 [Deltaproteobacteria bacterium Smac51]